MWRQFINCTIGKQSCSPILSFLLKKQFCCLEGIFSFAFNGSVVTEAWSIKEKSIKEKKWKRSANTAKEELFWYCSCLNWTVGCPDHHSWHTAIQNHSVLQPLTSTINYSFICMHQWRGNLEYCTTCVINFYEKMFVFLTKGHIFILSTVQILALDRQGAKFLLPI